MGYTPSTLSRRSNPICAGQAVESRSEFARDRDRLIYSNAFRRLAGKSQVVASLELGSFHTRLTHSLKVAQLGRRLAERLRNAYGETDGSACPDPDLVEFACLAHDLGHPPFGHAGEEALHLTMEKRLAAPSEAPPEQQNLSVKARLDLGGFEGNPQSFRLVSRLSTKWLDSDGQDRIPSEWFGLDLTAASLDAVTKYPWRRSSLDQKKWGCYGTDSEYTDMATLVWSREATGAEIAVAENEAQGSLKCFEAQLMDWCDDVTYAVHDVEDFYQAGFIPLELLFATEPGEEWEDFREYVFSKWAAKGEEVSRDRIDAARTSLLNGVASMQPPGQFKGSANDNRLGHQRASGLLQYFLEGATYTGEPCLHKGTFRRHIEDELNESLQFECDLLKELIWKYVIGSAALATQQAGQQRIIRELIGYYSDNPQLLPLDLREMLTRPLSLGYSDPDLASLRAAADYVSGMTEQHAIVVHRRLTGIDLGGFKDPI